MDDDEKERRRLAERAHDAEKEFRNEATRAAIEASAQALRAFFIINGGAAVAMLAYLSRIGPIDEKADETLKLLAASLSWFGWGVAAAALGSGLAYLTNYCVASASAQRDLHYTHPHVRENMKSRTWFVFSTIFQVLAVLAAFGSLVLFLCGVYAVKSSLLPPG
jgi:hypothetical protein